MNIKSLARFNKYIEKTDNCWNWTGAIVSTGYGHFYLNGKRVLAHRISYSIYNGEIPNSLHIDHLCRNRHCVNPSHLEAVTHRENILRGTGVTAVNAKKTHCVNGHEFSDKNTLYYYRKGRKNVSRSCRQCRQIRVAKWRIKEAV